MPEKGTTQHRVHREQLKLGGLLSEEMNSKPAKEMDT